MEGCKVEKKGKVWLVGAGPSDMGLLTFKGKNLIEQADVVVYDALVSASILSMIPSSAQAIFVGKRAGNHPVPQEQINQILLEQAMQGKRVVRLKGGDPFLFGRGGEELELLIENGIDYEVVPGVTSAIAVPAYNGIPVTHRDYCSSVHIITAHSKKGGELKIDFEALCRLNGTLVFLMGSYRNADDLQRSIGGGNGPADACRYPAAGNQCHAEKGGRHHFGSSGKGTAGTKFRHRLFW